MLALKRKQLMVVLAAIAIFALLAILRLILDPQARGAIDVNAAYNELGAQLEAAGLLFPPDTPSSIEKLESLAVDPTQVIAEQVVNERYPSVRIDNTLAIYHREDNDLGVRAVVYPGGYAALTSGPLRRAVQTLSKASRSLQARVLAGSSDVSSQTYFSYTYSSGSGFFVFTPTFHEEECWRIDIVPARD